MAALAEKIGLKAFRAQYANEKPYWELLNGEAVQKAMPTELHSLLQFILAVLLNELGYAARPELTLSIDDEWEPIPDVCGVLGTPEHPYPTRAVAVAIEVLSPDDRFFLVLRKCRGYAAWGIQDILVFDPVDRTAWYWDKSFSELRSIQESYRCNSLPVEIALADVWGRLDRNSPK